MAPESKGSTGTGEEKALMKGVAEQDDTEPPAGFVFSNGVFDVATRIPSSSVNIDSTALAAATVEAETSRRTKRQAQSSISSTPNFSSPANSKIGTIFATKKVDVIDLTVSPPRILRRDQENPRKVDRPPAFHKKQRTEIDVQVASQTTLVQQSNENTQFGINSHNDQSYGVPDYRVLDKITGSSTTLEVKPQSKTPLQRPGRYKTFDSHIYRKGKRDERNALLKSKLLDEFPEDTAFINGFSTDPESMGDGAYIFLDYSNIYHGSEGFYKLWSKAKPKTSVPVLQMEALDFLFSRGRRVLGRYLTTSQHGRSELQQQVTVAQKICNYQVRLLQRINTPSGRKEQAVDELLQKDMADVLLDHAEKTGIVVLGTGDGNNAEFDQGGFPKAVRRFLLKGWRVELFSWASSLNHVWQQLVEEYPENMRIYDLENWASALFERPDTIRDFNPVTEIRPRVPTGNRAHPSGQHPSILTHPRPVDHSINSPLTTSLLTAETKPADQIQSTGVQPDISKSTTTQLDYTPSVFGSPGLMTLLEAIPGSTDATAHEG